MPRPINLALQGGGAHGAFTWGVLDALLQDERIRIDAISGTSAGAMNAVVLADGLTLGGRDAAREQLERFWLAVASRAAFSPIRRSPIDQVLGNWSVERSPGFFWFDAFTRAVSPYQSNPFNFNPLRDVLESTVDFDRVRACDQVEVFVSATNVETGRVKVFERAHLTAEMVMASACLPQIQQAVVIDGVPYWDGGYAGNPVLFPFFSRRGSADIVIVQINPIERKGAPMTAQGILDRVNEITFNNSLLKELRAIDFVTRLLRNGTLKDPNYREFFVHMIENETVLNALGASTKLNAEREFLVHLRDIGRDTAQRWIEANIDALGERSSIDLRAMFEGRASD